MRLDKTKIPGMLAIFFVFALLSFALSFYPASSTGWFTSRVYIHGSTPSAAAGIMAASIEDDDEETEEYEEYIEEEIETTEYESEEAEIAEFEFEEEEE